GVVLTAFIAFVILWAVLGWSFEMSLLVSVIISSTDAAATFSILRRQSIPPRLSSTLEIESAANDPMAILLTLAAMQTLTAGETKWYIVLLLFIWKFVTGVFMGWFLGSLAVWVFNRTRPAVRVHYYWLYPAYTTN